MDVEKALEKTPSILQQRLNKQPTLPLQNNFFKDPTKPHNWPGLDPGPAAYRSCDPGQALFPSLWKTLSPYMGAT